MANHCHNTTGLPVNRRRLMLAGPALVAASALPSAAIARTPTPIAAMFQQWREYSAWLEGPATDGMPEEEFNAAVDVKNDLEDLMIATPPRDATDVLMMIAAYADFGIGDVPCALHVPELWVHIRAILGEEVAA